MPRRTSPVKGRTLLTQCCQEPRSRDGRARPEAGATLVTPRTDIKEGSFAVVQDPGARIGVFQKAE